MQNKTTGSSKAVCTHTQSTYIGSCRHVYILLLVEEFVVTDSLAL